MSAHPPGPPAAHPANATREHDATQSDDQLVARLRDLTLVDLDVLLAGASAEQVEVLLDAHAGDLADALRAARVRMHALVREVAAGPDPFGLLDADARLRSSENARAAGERSARRLTARAHACRALARLDVLAAQVLPRLLEADRRRHGHL
jgi:hypothetical protein